MDELGDDFEEKVEKNEGGGLDEEIPLLGLGGDDDTEDDEDEDKLLNEFGFTVDDDDPPVDF